MLTIKTIVKYSPIHGLGCFAAQDIKKGEVVWILDPRFDLSFPVSELQQYLPSFVDFIHMYAYRPLDSEKDELILCCDNSRHMNHSTSPNLGEGPEGSNVAIRDIKEGEELTCDYTLFDKDFKKKLGQ